MAELEEWARESKIPLYTSWNKQNPLSDPIQCGRYRVDVAYDQDTFAALFECDEDQHSHYDRACELVRQGKIALSYGGKPVRFVRYNPDAFKVGGMTRRTGNDERKRVLLDHLQNVFGDNTWIYQNDTQDSLNFMIVDYLFYDPIIPGSAGGLVQTFKFATLQEYEEWAEGLAPDVMDDDGDDATTMKGDDTRTMKDDDATMEVDASGTVPTPMNASGTVLTTTPTPTTTTSRWGRRLKLAGSARAHLYTFLLRIP